MCTHQKHCQIQQTTQLTSWWHQHGDQIGPQLCQYRHGKIWRAFSIHLPHSDTSLEKVHRYIAFSFSTGTKDSLSDFINYLNSCDRNINFSYEYSVNFLDTTVIPDNHKFKLDLYSKPTDTQLPSWHLLTPQEVQRYQSFQSILMCQTNLQYTLRLRQTHEKHDCLLSRQGCTPSTFSRRQPLKLGEWIETSSFTPPLLSQLKTLIIPFWWLLFTQKMIVLDTLLLRTGPF